MYAGDVPVGYSNADDTESLRTIHAALDAGISVFDTAAAYGAGHSEKLLGKALKSHSDSIVVTKIGIGIDEKSRSYTGADFSAPAVQPAIDACLRRLDRDRIDLVLLHLNEMSVEDALPGFDELEHARQAGKIRAFGWSTDFTASAEAMIGRHGFAAIEHAMNVFVDVPRMQTLLKSNNVPALIRSPLAMGLLSGKYDADSVMPSNDIRSSQQAWMGYFSDGRVAPTYLKNLNAVRDLLKSDGRSLVQGALAWLWAKNPLNLPVPGARTITHIEGIAGALAHGPLSSSTMEEIENLITREPADTSDRPR